MGTLLQDLRYGFRMLLKSPPLPYAHSEQVVVAWESNVSKGWERTPVSPRDFADLRKLDRVFDALVALRYE